MLAQTMLFHSFWAKFYFNSNFDYKSAMISFIIHFTYQKCAKTDTWKPGKKNEKVSPLNLILQKFQTFSIQLFFFSQNLEKSYKDYKEWIAMITAQSSDILTINLLPRRRRAFSSSFGTDASSARKCARFSLCFIAWGIEFFYKTSFI